MDRWLTPDTPATGRICRRLLIPNGIDWLAIVSGALLPLTYDFNFEPFGTATPSQTAQLFQEMYEHFLSDEGEECRLIGEIVTYAGSTNPSSNFLPCDGASVLRIDYPDLFTVIGTTYGSIDGAHFNVPDLRSRVALGAGQGTGLSNYNLGDTGGEEAHTLNTAELPSHTHTDAGHVHSEGIAAPAIGAAITGVPVPSAVPAVGVTGVGNAAISSSGGGGAHENRQPYLALNYFIVALP